MEQKQIAVEGVCPVCGSQDIDYGVFEMEDTYGYYPCECNECHATFNETYDLELYGQNEVVEGDVEYNGREDVMADNKVEGIIENDTLEDIVNTFDCNNISVEIYREEDNTISLYIADENSSSAIYKVNSIRDIGRALEKYFVSNT